MWLKNCDRALRWNLFDKKKKNAIKNLRVFIILGWELILRSPPLPPKPQRTNHRGMNTNENRTCRYYWLTAYVLETCFVDQWSTDWSISVFFCFYRIRFPLVSLTGIIGYCWSIKKRLKLFSVTQSKIVIWSQRVGNSCQLFGRDYFSYE